MDVGTLQDDLVAESRIHPSHMSVHTQQPSTLLTQQQQAEKELQAWVSLLYYICRIFCLYSPSQKLTPLEMHFIAAEAASPTVAFRWSVYKSQDVGGLHGKHA